ncbi:glycosyltransferase [Archangium violaceum]|uniref:Glycosyltransferase n=1 Tax=Archangium violaceum Cb vi76 TaxID=1406225 RepID=A0A084T1Q3_9BACT|nr:hypothetical protein [Archangium violaceum]KFA94638.1 hypothetical protein Q664_01665 [Archangium violaceum Cb vi76]
MRVAILGRPMFEPHVPRTADWAELRFLALGEEDGASAADEARTWGAEACLVLEPQRLAQGVVARLPGMKIGIIPVPLDGGETFEKLSALVRPGGSGFRWLTWPESPVPSGLAALPWLQTLPLPVDTHRFTEGPRLHRTRILVPEWASPATSVLDRIRERADIEPLPRGLESSALLERLEGAGVLLYSTHEPLGRNDPLPMLALSRGLLLITDTPFPSDWCVEPEDEFLVRGGEAMVRAMDELVRRPGSFHAVRVRAWQKVRESFEASALFQRLLHDASLLSGAEERGPASAGPSTG